ncbi:MAG TPA: phage holin family protein [Steroidobacteraceae bacterium]
MMEAGQPIIGRGKSILQQLLRIAQTRLELLSVELQQEKLAVARQVRLAAIMVVCAWLAGLTLILWIALVLPPERRSLFLGVLFFLLLLGAVICAVMLRRQKRREPLFSRVIHQLQLDRHALSTDELEHPQ